jgi:hypothetical protein
MTINEAWWPYQEHLLNGPTDAFGHPVPGRIPGGYASHLARLSNKIRTIPMRKLAANPDLMAKEMARIRKRLNKGRRDWHGRLAAMRSARVVDGLFKFLRKRDPSLVDDPLSTVAIQGGLQGVQRRPTSPPAAPQSPPVKTR